MHIPILLNLLLLDLSRLGLVLRNSSTGRLGRGCSARAGSACVWVFVGLFGEEKCVQKFGVLLSGRARTWCLRWRSGPVHLIYEVELVVWLESVCVCSLKTCCLMERNYLGNLQRYIYTWSWFIIPAKISNTASRTSAMILCPWKRELSTCCSWPSSEGPRNLDALAPERLTPRHLYRFQNSGGAAPWFRLWRYACRASFWRVQWRCWSLALRISGILAVANTFIEF